ncbi:hypothetical protein [Oleiharenicola sp. Vm1]|uniref:hypothetical protein n=1 Tax=Oleiharenicola sp. Vm1 TaxID=3398393 RepID=UPI0039F5A55A
MCALASSLVLSHAVILAADHTTLQPIGAVAATARTAQGVLLTAADGSTVAVSVFAPDLVRVRTLSPGRSPRSTTPGPSPRPTGPPSPSNFPRTPPPSRSPPPS